MSEPVWSELLRRLGAGEGEVVVPAPGAGPGFWSGAASAVCADGATWLAYRSRRPLAAGRGVSTVVARSVDGVHFETVTQVHRDDFGAESFERPVLMPLPEGGWRLYLSCAVPGSKHWWIDTLTAPRVEDLASGERRAIDLDIPGVALKDPVIATGADGQWHMWVCCHPLDVPGAEDRMWTSYASSPDGLTWTDHGPVLTGRAGRWDERGARITAVLDADRVLYDGRPDAASNWHESTGVARRDGQSVHAGGRLVATDDEPVRSPYSDGALRYASAVTDADGRARLHVERARPDGAHDLVTLAA